MNKKEFESKIEKIDLTILQRALLTDVNSYVEDYGQFILIQSYIGNKYKEVATIEEIVNDFNYFITQGIIISTNQKYIFNGKFRTKRVMHINYDLLFSIKYSKVKNILDSAKARQKALQDLDNEDIIDIVKVKQLLEKSISEENYEQAIIYRELINKLQK